MLVDNLILGITGSIASGKSTVAAAFVERGAALVDADQLAREVVLPHGTVLPRLVKRFGPQLLLADGCLNREKLAEIIFGDAQARKDLNRIMHPEIASLAVARLQQLKSTPGLSLVVYEAPLLFEAAAEGRVDRVLVVKVDPQVQLQRLLERDGISEAEARRRMAAQMSQQDKLARADYVIDNSGTLENTRRQVERLWQELVAERSV